VINAIVRFKEKYNFSYQVLLDDKTVFPPEEKTDPTPVVYKFESFSKIKSGRLLKKLVDIYGTITNVSKLKTYVPTSRIYRVIDLEDDRGDEIALFLWNDDNPVVNTW
jgi:hypothetical protein